ncbi:MAG TPA: M1 family aminopeptidase [Candidatus Acidoferrales bacterium]|nr:M1 family aminopeptidase [Candidatus Acidoferrales bacterium]
MNVKTVAYSRTLLPLFALTSVMVGPCAGTTRAQELPRFDFRASHYEVQATLRPADQTIKAEVKVELVAKTESRTILVQLHPDLHVDSVRLAVDGRKLDFLRDSFSPLNLAVTLPSAAQPGMHVALIFNYSGAFSNDDDSPTKDVRFAWIDKNSAYLLLPARWFPLTDYPSNRYTAKFQITVPDNFAVVGTGQSSAPTSLPAEKPEEGGRTTYTFTCDDAAPVGTFVAGDLRLSPVRAQGMALSVFAPPAAAATASPYGDELANIITYFSSKFGALSSTNLTLAQLPDGSVDGFSAPGVLFLSAHEWGSKVNQGALANLAAGQWWGNQVLAATASDAWVTDGLAQYSAAMYIEHAQDAAGYHRQLTDFAIGSVMFEDTSPIAQAGHLQPFSQQYRSVVVDKGAMVFHMLRTAMGDSAFDALLHDFYAAHAGGTASIDDFEKLAQAKLPPAKPGEAQLNLLAFFSQWLNSTGIPDFKIDYIVYRTEKGFKVIGKVQQPLETFNMPVEIRVDTEGNPVTKTVQVIGTSTPFEIDSFNQPKPGGIVIDPSNDILKSSPLLKVRSLIARGEGLAQQGKFYDAIQQYQSALSLQPNSSLAAFRMAEAFFYQKNYAAAADSFRNALDGQMDPGEKWVEVWCHIYLGKIFDLTGSRERAINEYQKAQELKDNTGGAQEEAEKYMKAPYTGEGAPVAASPAAKPAKQ